MNPVDLTEWLRGLSSYIKATKAEYPRNVVRGQPIPFFGNVLTAKILTLGVNPSSGEFEPKRGWGTVRKVSDWQHRLLNYFAHPEVDSHEWFEPWSISLELLGASYADGSAAHLDISPRPTIAMFRNPKIDHREFRSMAEQDVKWCFDLIRQLDQIKLILVAGPIPHGNGKKQQLGDFMRERCENHEMRWEHSNLLPTINDIPVFICKYEPDVDSRYSIVRQIYRNREMLRGLL